MKTIKVEASVSYEVQIGSGLLTGCGERIRAVTPRAVRCVLVTDDTVAPLYAERVERELADAGYECARFVIPSGEQSKNAESFIRLLNFCADFRLTRTDLIAALGGGVVGDLAGFAAASYMRGVSFVQLPTTLLAAVDSSVGGKTAIDLDAGKNLAGAFYQPSLVLCDYDTLATLRPEVFTDGCAEVIKYSVLGDEALFAHLEQRGQDFDTEYVIARCVEMKRDIVNADEFETGCRRLLNLGHTLGHAVEKRSGFALSHGRSVAIGLAAVAHSAASEGICTPECAERIIRCLRRFGLPTETEYGLDELYDIMLSDKKRSGDSVSIIVPEKIGACRVEPMPVARAKEFFAH